ncbi:gag-pol polyprotein [Tanacetum coccineum]
MKLGSSGSHNHSKSKTGKKKNYKCFKCGEPGHFRKDCRGLNTSNPQRNVASTSEDGNALCCEAAVANEGKKRFADDVRHVEGLKKNLLSLRQLVDLGCKVEIQNKIMKIIRARAMLATASLGKSFWAEVVNTTCYVINRLPSTAVELKTPMEMWTGKPGYRLWDPTAHKVDVSRDVVFMEDKIQENKEGDSTTSETTSIQMEKEFQSNDSFELASAREEGEPSTLQEALNNPDASFWKAAMQEEI